MIAMTDREKFLEQARKYIGVNGDYVCNKKLGLGVVVDWCAYSISAIMNDCGFIGKYQGGIYGFASDAAREDSGKLGEWFRKGEKTPQPGDYIMFRYASFTNPIDKFSASHVGIVEAVNGDEGMTETRTIKEISYGSEDELLTTDGQTKNIDKSVFDLSFLSGLVDFGVMTPEQKLGYCQAIFVTSGVSAEELTSAAMNDEKLKNISYEELTSLVYTYGDKI